MSTVVPLIRGSTGLNTKDDPVRIAYSPQSGISDLAVAVNVSISPSGRIDRRKGKTSRISLDSLSLFCNGGECVFVHDSGLYLLETNFSYRLLKALSFNNRVAYVQVGNRIYFTNTYDLGYVENGIAYDWEKTTNYVGPTTQKIYTGPFPGNHLAYHGGRIYISTANILWWSEYSSHSWFDMARNFIPFNTHIRMIKPVRSGVFVSTSRAIYFLHGLVPSDFVQAKIVNYPALEWSDAIDYVDGIDIHESGISGPCALWVTPEGAMLGGPDGNVINLNKQKVVYPEGTRGTSLLMGLNFIHTVE